MNVYAIYDNKVEAFINTPFFARTNGEAIRMFSGAVNTEGSDFNRWPNDYCLYHVGFWGPEDGTIIPEVPHKNLGLAIEYLQKPMTPALVSPQKD